jgi:glycolate oxidase iron-sulfur subunit
VLRGIPGFTFSDIPEAEICCGSTGISNPVQPEPAERLGRREVEQITSTTPDAIVTSDAGYLLQTGATSTPGAPPLFHPVQLVDASIPRCRIGPRR